MLVFHPIPVLFFKLLELQALDQNSFFFFFPLSRYEAYGANLTRAAVEELPQLFHIEQ